MLYQHFAYVSQATMSLSPYEIDLLLSDARKFNVEHNITGILLFDKNKFFQFLEGSPESIDLVYQRIKNSKQHTSILELTNRFTKQRYFKDWNMGFSYAPKTELQKISQATWRTQLSKVKHYSNECIGLELLLEFCSENFKDFSKNPYKQEA